MKTYKKLEEENKGFAVASLVCGILSLVMPYISTILGILAIVFYTKKRDSRMSKAGLVTGIIGLVFSIIMWVIILSIVSLAGMFK